MAIARSFIEEHPEITINNVLYSNKERGKTFIFLEAGKIDECFEKFFDEENVHIIMSCGKDNVVKCMTKLEERMKGKPIKNYLGIIDRDFDFIYFKETIEAYPENLFETDTHDQETMIFRSEALEDFLIAHADGEKLARFEKRQNKDIRDIILDSAATIGSAVCVTLEDPIKGKIKAKNRRLPSLNFLMDERDLKNYLIQDTLEIDLEEFFQDYNFANQYNFKLIEPHQITEKSAQLSPDQKWEVANGHHMSSILAVGVNQLFGKIENHGKDLDRRFVEKQMARLYTLKLFINTRLYGSIRSWEKTNKPVFKELDDEKAVCSI